jgi:hypothetical protein
MVFITTVKRLLATPHRSFSLATVLALVSVVAVGADEAAPAPLFSVRTTRGTAVQGAWRELKADWSVRVGEGDGSRIAGDNVLSVRRAGAPLPPLPDEDHLVLINGDRVPYEDKTLRLADEKLQFHHPNLEGGKEASLSLAAVSLLWRIAPDKTLDAERLRRRLAAVTRTQDTVCLRNGDIVAGVLTALDKENVEVETEKRRVAVKMPQVAYIAFNTELAEAPRPKGVYARLILTGTSAGHGGRLSLTSASCDGVTLTGVTVFGARLRVPLGEVASLDLRHGRAVYLSDLKPSNYDYRPYLDAAWPYTVDANVVEHDLRLGGSTYDKGIGLHSHSRLTYRLSGAYRRFDALVGLDEKDGRRGRVRIRVLADAKVRVDRELKLTDGPLPIDVSVEGVRELTLEVDFGRDADVEDVVNWVDARLVK